MAAAALMPISTAAVGPIAGAVGVQETLVGMSVLGVACALAFLAVPGVRALQRG